MKIISTKGQGPVLNVVHGWGMNAHLLDDWSDELALYFKINLIDLPGHGLNHQEIFSLDLNVLAKQASEIPKGMWLGWSMGGMLALNLALKNPKQVDALIMLCATPCFISRDHWPHGTNIDVLDQFAKNLQLDIKQTIETFLALEVMGVNNQHAQLKVLKEKVFERPLPSEQALNTGLQLLKQVDLSTQLKNLKPPSLWISGRRDRLVLPAAMQQAAQLCGGDYQMLKGSGHAPFIRQAADLTALIRNFIQNIL